jgi:hypothetical protein
MFKKWYVPGMISLFGIFPLLFWKTMPLKQQFDQRVINVFLPYEGDVDDSILMFSEELVLKDVAKRRQTVFYLNDFIEQTASVLDAIRRSGREIKYGYDTSRVVKVVLGDHCSFNAFVSVLNICIADEHRRYAWVQDTIFIFSPPPPEPEKYFYGCGLIQEIYPTPHAEAWYQGVIRQLKDNWVIFSTFLALSFFSLRNLIQRINVRTES